MGFGVLLKRTCKKELLYALRKLMADRLYIPASVVLGLQGHRTRVRPSQRHKTLTRRQREVLKLLAEGRNEGYSRHFETKYEHRSVS